MNTSGSSLCPFTHFFLIRIKTDPSEETENNLEHVYQADQGGDETSIERPVAHLSPLQLGLCSARHQVSKQP